MHNNRDNDANIIYNNNINRDDYYFNNNNKINMGATKLYAILNNFRNLNRIQRIDFERNFEHVFNNPNIFTDINDVFKKMGFSKEKTIKFLIFKFIVSVSGTKMNSICNELIYIKDEINIVRNFNQNKNSLQKEFDNLKKACSIEKEQLHNLQVLTHAAEKCIPIEVRCSICISNTKSHIIVPCGHKSICGDCAPQTLNGGTCPICRTPIESIIKVFEA